ncbi:Uma2 family endonuclease [Oxynema aestuarii]|uniref:Uma2 family endonuclease n=1 Tax=Oxynema aestuarii AP17 TaxID=2064643 RepID=A0A6H1U4P2_9CYAN|nr:Uma2 family endonuclease [Oxynema aestuarii]QIZ73003.1 Uma2 family endonuclease [Oxynema aestuarii AP17]
MNIITLDLKPLCAIDDEQFYQLCRANPELKFERNANGEILIMSPTGGETGNCNAELLIEFGIWNRQTKLGKLFDSSTCFKLPNGANRSPDLAWVKVERWDGLTATEKEKFPPLAPDFVLELKSPTDHLSTLQAKLEEYIENGVKLAWLIDRETNRVEVYRPGRDKQVFEKPATLSGEEILPGFVLSFEEIWK